MSPPRAAATAPPGIRLHRTRSLDARDTTTHRGIRITTLAKTFLDLAATARRTTSSTRSARPCATRSTITARSRTSCGTKALRQATVDPTFTRGDIERRFRRLCRRAGLPQPLSNHVVADADNHPHEVDFYFPAYGLIVETDGWRDHGTRVAFERDRAKDAALVAAGYTVLRFTKRQIADDPDTVAERVRAGCCRASASAPAPAL